MPQPPFLLLICDWSLNGGFFALIRCIVGVVGGLVTVAEAEPSGSGSRRCCCPLVLLSGASDFRERGFIYLFVDYWTDAQGSDRCGAKSRQTPSAGGWRSARCGGVWKSCARS